MKNISVLNSEREEAKQRDLALVKKHFIAGDIDENQIFSVEKYFEEENCKTNLVAEVEKEYFLFSKILRSTQKDFQELI